jgi:hypothetical protein
MFIGHFRRIRGKWLGWALQWVGRNDQLGWSAGNRWLLGLRGKQRYGRQQLGRPDLDGRRARLGWIDNNGWNDGNGWNDNGEIRRRDQLRRKVGVWWEHRYRWLCGWR